jgi:hypothetical protein
MTFKPGNSRQGARNQLGNGITRNAPEYNRHSTQAFDVVVCVRDRSFSLSLAFRLFSLTQQYYIA